MQLPGGFIISADANFALCSSMSRSAQIWSKSGPMLPSPCPIGPLAQLAKANDRADQTEKRTELAWTLLERWAAGHHDLVCQASISYGAHDRLNAISPYR
jgi:hypothetical protein